MLWEFKNNKINTEAAQKIYSDYGQGVNTDHLVQNCLSKLRHWEINPD